MPHVEVQYSSNLADFDFKPLLKSISQALVVHCNADMSTVMARTIEVTDCVLDGQEAYDQALCFVKIMMKSGRNAKQKEALLNAVEADLRDGILTHTHERQLACHPRIMLKELPKDYREVV